MARGLPKSYIKKYGITKRAWREYRKAKGSRKSPKRTKSVKKRARTRRVSRKTGGVRRVGRKFTIALPLWIGVGASISGKDSPLGYAMQGDFNSVLVSLGKRFTGYDANIGGFGSMKNFLYNISKGVGPIFAGIVVHKIAKLLGVNRYLASAKVPLVRL